MMASLSVTHVCVYLTLILVWQEDAEAARLKEERLAEYAARKAKSTSDYTLSDWPTLHDDQLITIFRLTA